MARTAIAQRGNRHGSPSTLRARLHAIIERALVLLDQLDDDPDAEPSLCGLTVDVGDDQEREGPDDNGVADHDGLMWVHGGTVPMPPERIKTRRARRNSRQP